MPGAKMGFDVDFGDIVYFREIQRLNEEVDTWKIRYDERIVREIEEYKRRRECNKTCCQTPPQDEE